MRRNFSHLCGPQEEAIRPPVKSLTAWNTLFLHIQDELQCLC